MAATGTDTSAASGGATIRRSEAAYVVQMRDPDHADGKVWEDVATVTVPAKTKRKTVIAKAVEEAGTDLTLLPTMPVRLRVIPAEHAEEIKVEMEQPPPQLKIG